MKLEYNYMALSSAVMEGESSLEPESDRIMGIREILFEGGFMEQEIASNTSHFYIDNYDSKIAALLQHHPDAVTYNSRDVSGGLSMAIVIDGDEIFYVFDLKKR